jgi:hypothetical protein
MNWYRLSSTGPIEARLRKKRNVISRRVRELTKAIQNANETYNAHPELAVAYHNTIGDLNRKLDIAKKELASVEVEIRNFQHPETGLFE